MTEKWAQDCARYEAGGAGEYLKAALEYEKQNNDGWSAAAIADEVVGAGFQISASTVKRRLAALAETRATVRARTNSKAFLEAFAEAYAGVNAMGRGGQTPLDPETARRVYLTGIVSEFDRLFGSDGWDLVDEERLAIEAIRDRCDAVLAGRPFLEVAS